MSILKTPREEEVARETLRRSTRPRSKPAVLCMDAPPRNNKKKPSPRPPAPSSGSLRSNSTGSSGLHSSFASSHIAEQLSKIVQQQQQFQRQVLKDMRQRQSPPTPAVQPVTIQQPNPTQHRPPKNNKRKRDKHDRRVKKKMKKKLAKMKKQLRLMRQIGAGRATPTPAYPATARSPSAHPASVPPPQCYHHPNKVETD